MLAAQSLIYLIYNIPGRPSKLPTVSRGWKLATAPQNIFGGISNKNSRTVVCYGADGILPLNSMAHSLWIRYYSRSCVLYFRPFVGSQWQTRLACDTMLADGIVRMQTRRKLFVLYLRLILGPRRARYALLTVARMHDPPKHSFGALALTFGHTYPDRTWL